MSKKSNEAKYSFAFASDIQSLADEKHVKVANFNVQKRRNHHGSYDFMTVNFVIPRPDRDAQNQDEASEEKSFDNIIHEIEESVEAPDQDDLGKDNEVISQ